MIRSGVLTKNHGFLDELDWSASREAIGVGVILEVSAGERGNSRMAG
jgi:hypothetical protein